MTELMLQENSRHAQKRPATSPGTEALKAQLRFVVHCMASCYLMP